ncbi:uncharacterized protein LOC129574513 [Sitodiplosis mosellana]|uniref:uncharacterized protein LOC129574513 n=1 Tax=Sitodiplosis mosellana TaxID=263140 RepID=UPI002443CFBF|nr:uncharacterized protein LOC129574513 [Sitodiplosis mosellana]XP_055312569.1 uncharacterized protein LOC129574513 [Sitodiplosis mosellana]
MDEEQQSCCCGWRFCRIVGLTIGWLGVILSFILIYALCKHPGLFGKSVHESIIPFLPALNLVSSYSWIFGIDRNKLEFALASLIWWGTNLSLVFVCMISYFFADHGDKPRSHVREMYFLLAIDYWVCSYVIALFCYKSMKRVHKNPEVTV